MALRHVPESKLILPINHKPEAQIDIVWTLPILTAALQNAIRQTIIPLKICFFIDGLDEFDGSHEEIGKLLLELNTADNVKGCVSSWSTVVFKSLFHELPKLRLQELVWADIQQYVVDKLQESCVCIELIIRQPEATQQLGVDIVQK